MALDSQTIQFPLMKGINTKVDSKQIPLGEMSLLENAVFKTIQKFRKRNGYTALTRDVLTLQPTFTFPKVTTTISAGSFCADFKSEKIMGDGFSLYSYSDADAKWAYKGRCESARTGQTSIYQDTPTQMHPDSAVNLTSGLSLYAWESYANQPDVFGVSFGVQYSLVDTASGTTIFTSILANTTSRPRCVAIGSFLYLFYYDTSGTRLKARLISSTGTGAATDVITDIDTTTPNYDVLVNNSLIYVGYNGTGSTVKIASFNSSLVNQASASKAEVASNGIGIFADTSNNIWVAYNNATDTKAFIMNSALAVTVLAATTVEAAVSNVQNVTGIYDGTRGVIFYDIPGVRALGQTTGITTSAGYNQPAVGSGVTVNTSGDLTSLIGQIIYVAGGGYYRLGAATATSITIVNLGGSGNVAPTTAVANPAAISPALSFSNASIRENTLTAAGTAGTAGVLASSVALSSRAFLYGSIAHVLSCFDSATQPTYFLCALYDVSSLATNTPKAHFSARVASNFAGGIPIKGCLSSVNTISSGLFKCALTDRIFTITKTQDDVAQSQFFNGVFASEINLAPTQVSKQELGNNMHIASGTLMMYDGEAVVEHGFHMFPDYLTASRDGVVSGRVANGDYAYCALYAWTDAQGQIHRSAPSGILNFTASGGNSAINVVIPTLRVTQKDDAVIEVYRTTASGSIFFRIDSNYIGTTSYPTANLVGANTITFTDIFSDDEISGNPQLYTSGEVENIVSPSPRSLSLFKNRLLVVPSDDTTTEWYSKQVVPGSPVELNDAFVQNTDQASGGIVGSVQLDDKWIFWKGENIYYTVGTGPAASGSGNDFTDPTLVATDVGLVDPESIIVMPYGAMFKSSKGVYILDRSFSVQYIGAKVESYNQYTVISAKLAASVNQVRFLLSNGQAIVYDYFINEWTVFTNYSGVDSMIAGGVYNFLKSDGTVMRETDGTYSDNGDYIVMKVRTGWIQFAGVEGFQRVWQSIILGEYISPHNLQVQVAVDFDPTVVQTVTYNPTALLPYQWRLNYARQKSAAFQLTIQDVDTGTDGEAYSLSNLSFEIGIKRGLNKVAATQAG